MAFEEVVEHLDHLGIMAEVFHEIGLAAYLDALRRHERVSAGTPCIPRKRRPS